MKTEHVQQLDRTVLSRHIENYTEENLKTIFRRLSPMIRQKWMDHFIEREEYEVCRVIREVMDENVI